jgi:hypothetical protein
MRDVMELAQASDSDPVYAAVAQWIGRITYWKCANRFLDGPLDRVEPALRCEKPRPSDTRLSAVHERDRKTSAVARSRTDQESRSEADVESTDLCRLMVPRCTLYMLQKGSLV